MVVRSGDELIDVVRKGQGVLNILALANVKNDIDAAILHFSTAPDAAKSAVRGPSPARIAG